MNKRLGETLYKSNARFLCKATVTANVTVGDSSNQVIE